MFSHLHPDSQGLLNDLGGPLEILHVNKQELFCRVMNFHVHSTDRAVHSLSELITHTFPQSCRIQQIPAVLNTIPVE